MHHGSQQCLQLSQAVAADDGCAGYVQLTTCGRFEHPCRDFQRSAISLLFKAAPTHGMSTLGQHLIDGDGATKPWVPRVEDFSRLGIMGVALSTCTTAISPMRRWRGDHRTQARRRVPHKRISIRIAGGRTVVGCIRRRSRRDVHTHTPRAAGAAGALGRLQRVD